MLPSGGSLPLIDFYEVIRCTCGKPISGATWDMYKRLTTTGITTKEYLRDTELAEVIGIVPDKPLTPEDALEFIDPYQRMKRCCRVSVFNPFAVISDRQERDYVEGKRQASVVEPIINSRFVYSLPTQFIQTSNVPALESQTIPEKKDKSKSSLSSIASGEKITSLPVLSDVFSNLSISQGEKINIKIPEERRVNVGSGMTVSIVPTRKIRAI